jgi:hypothetical protein
MEVSGTHKALAAASRMLSPWFIPSWLWSCQPWFSVAGSPPQSPSHDPSLKPSSGALCPVPALLQHTVRSLIPFAVCLSLELRDTLLVLESMASTKPAQAGLGSQAPLLPRPVLSEPSLCHSGSPTAPQEGQGQEDRAQGCSPRHPGSIRSVKDQPNPAVWELTGVCHPTL